MSQKVVIIGAGPAGILLAHYLLQRPNYEVHVYERRPDPRLSDFSQTRTFPLSLQARGRKALRGIPGLEEAIASQSTFCRGTVVYKQNGKARKIPRENPVLSIDRHRLVGILLQQLAENCNAHRLTINFDCQCTEIDSNAKTVTLQKEEGESFTINYDILVGADGARSCVRDYLVEKNNLQCETSYVRDSYKSVFLSRINPQTGLELDPDKIHSSNRDNNIRMLLVPQPQNRLNGVIIFPSHNNPFENLSTPEEILGYFQENFPIFGQLMSLEEAADFIHRPVSTVLTVQCDRFDDGDSILLIGDAAHAVSPSIGQGCNSSLEDVLILNQLLEQYSDNWSQVLPSFSQQRIPDAHALRELSDYSFPRKKLLVFEFFFQLQLKRVLHKLFPQWVQLFLFDLVLDTDLPYSQVLNLSQNWVNKVKRSMVEKG